MPGICDSCSDLADARAAAAWIEGRDVALNEFDRVLYWPRKEGAQTKHFRQVLTPPTDLAAALDRLIAERVREARAYAREAIIHASNNLSTHLEQYHDYEDETPERRNLRGIMHHLEGTLMGMDDDEDALIARRVREARLAAFDEIAVAVANAIRARCSKEGRDASTKAD